MQHSNIVHPETYHFFFLESLNNHDRRGEETQNVKQVIVTCFHTSMTWIFGDFHGEGGIVTSQATKPNRRMHRRFVSFSSHEAPKKERLGDRNAERIWKDWLELRWNCLNDLGTIWTTCIILYQLVSLVLSTLDQGTLWMSCKICERASA